MRSLPLLSVLAMLRVQQNWKTRKGGAEHYGRCPLHSSKRNTTSFSMDSSGRFHCFSCGAKGRGAIDLVMAYNKVGFKEAVTWLTSQTPQVQSAPQTTSIAVEPVSELLENVPYKSSYEKFKVESGWVKERGFTGETLEPFGVFEYNNPKRKSIYSGSIMIPIKRFLDGATVGYLARLRQGDVKYLWPKGVLKSLEIFGAWHLRSEQPHRVGYLVESPFAVMKFHQLGFPAVSCYGWSVSSEQTSILRDLAKGWVFLPDADRRKEALQQVVPLLVQRSWMKCPEYPCSDPELLTREQIQAL